MWLDLSIGDLVASRLVTVRSSPIAEVGLEILERNLKVNYVEMNCRVNELDFVW